VQSVYTVSGPPLVNSPNQVRIDAGKKVDRLLSIDRFSRLPFRSVWKGSGDSIDQFNFNFFGFHFDRLFCEFGLLI